MTGNSFGQLFKITTCGESHGGAVGVIIDGCPPGLSISEADIQPELDRRKPGQSAITTPRKEQDIIHILSGVFEGKTTGTPILLLAYNADMRPEDYQEMKNLYRPSHADFTYLKKYGRRDFRGSGRASARETLARVAAGAIAKKYLKQHLNIEIISFVEQVGHIRAEIDDKAVKLSDIEANIIRCPSQEAAKKMIELVEQVKSEGDSIGGVIKGIIRHVPAGLGEPVFDKLSADLGKAMLSINAVKGFEIGSGFSSVTMRGSAHNDPYIPITPQGASFSAEVTRDLNYFESEKPRNNLKIDVKSDAQLRTLRSNGYIIENNQLTLKTNYAGGIVGGISTGEDIYFRVAFKPVSTISQPQQTVNLQHEPVILEAAGRHDPCVLPRAVPIVDAMSALVVMDHYLRQLAILGNNPQTL